MSDDNKIAVARAWYKSKEALDKARKEETDLRKQAMEAYFGNEIGKGTQRESLNDKTALVLARTAKITIDTEAFLKHKAHMESKGLIGDDKVIEMRPVVSATAYKYMSDADKITFDEVFVHGLNAPTLKLEVKKS